MRKFHMIVDLEKCVGCFNCMLACKDENVGMASLHGRTAETRKQVDLPDDDGAWSGTIHRSYVCDQNVPAL